MSPHAVTETFERELAAYTGAPFAVATTSCTMALLLALAWCRRQYGRQWVELPKRTYVGVGMSVLHAGHDISFRDEAWTGEYQCKPFEVWDSARRFSRGIFKPGRMTCVSFHWAKHLAISQGGAVLLDNAEAYDWLRRARFDGRRADVHPKHDVFDFVGWHAYMSPSVAAEGLSRLALLPDDIADLPSSDYSDLSLAPIFGGNAIKPIAEAAE